MIAGQEDVEAEMRAITDGLGCAIDDGILDTVVTLRLLGINTIGSCAGHASRITGGPYVIFEDRSVAPIVHKLREIADPVDPTFRSLRRTVVRKNLRERSKLVPYLEAFYRSRYVPFETRLIIEAIGPEASCLKVQGAETAHILRKGQRSRLLLRHQAEMRTFTHFLSRQLDTGIR